ncbi:MAG TPA: ABC transporter ATP-binding protein [Nocardioidaceae bacterium]|nr:ABC transporter ATP-binding protein [Nocardioidaceae bacterium]
MTPGALLRDAARGRRSLVLGLAGWSLVATLPALLYGRLVASAVDDGFLAGEAGRGFLLLGLLAAAALVGAYATRCTYLRIAALVEPVRDDLVRRSVDGALRRSVAGRHVDGSAAARLSQHTEIVREALATVLMVVQGFLVAFVGAAFGLITLAPSLLLVVVPPVAIGLTLFGVSLPRLAARQRQAILAEERIAASTTRVLTGLADVAGSGGEDVARSLVDTHVADHAEAARELARLTALRTAAVAVAGWVPLVLLLLVGPSLVPDATPGVLLGALTYVTYVLHPAVEALVRGVGGPGLWLLVTLRRILEETEVPTVPSATDAVPQTPLPLVLDRVSFAYGVAATPVVQDLDLEVGAGDHLAVVGPSGVGKSTLAGLLTGVLAPSAGQVRVAGLPVSEVAPRALAGTRVLVPQQPYVFVGTLRENLTYHRPDLTDEELAAATAELGVEELLVRHAGESVLDPRALSDEERQLIALTRAYVAPAPLVILDEATCHLDATTEARIESAFARRQGSLVVIAHRISSARRARRVVLLDGNGVLVGTHEELLERSALYRDLVGHWDLSLSAR